MLNRQGLPGVSTILLLSTDLMVISRTDGFARAAGHRFLHQATLDDLSELVSERSVRILLDLGLRDISLSTLQQTFSAEVLDQSVAFGPHVHTELLQAAEQAGFGRVVSRGQFMSQLGLLLSPGDQGSS